MKGRTLPLHEQASDHARPHARFATTRELTTGLVRGDAAALEALYRAWFDRVVALVAKATGRDEAFCLDAAQDAFLRVIRSPIVIETEGELAAWLRRCVLSTAVDRLRREARASGRDRRAGGEGMRASSPDKAAQAAEQLAWIAERLRELGDSDQELVRLRFGVEQTLDEVARARGTTTGGVNGRLRRLVAALRSVAGGFVP